jgi:hypothetical protein
MDGARKIILFEKVKYIPNENAPSECNNAFLMATQDAFLVYVEGFIKVKRTDGDERRRHTWVFDPEINIAYEVKQLSISDLTLGEMIPGDRVAYYGYKIVEEEMAAGLRNRFVLSDDDLLPIYKMLTEEKT